MSKLNKNIYILITGSIACYKSAHLASSLVQQGYSVYFVATQSALKFIGKATLEGITGKHVYIDTFEDGQLMEHIHIVDRADLFICYPASANTINKMAMGVADNLVTTLFLSNNFRIPFWIAPAMNTNMLHHPATIESLGKLKKWGSYIFSTESGALACGAIGDGRLIDHTAVLDKINKEIK